MLYVCTPYYCTICIICIMYYIMRLVCPTQNDTILLYLHDTWYGVWYVTPGIIQATVCQFVHTGIGVKEHTITLQSNNQKNRKDASLEEELGLEMRYHIIHEHCCTTKSDMTDSAVLLLYSRSSRAFNHGGVFGFLSEQIPTLLHLYSYLYR